MDVTPAATATATAASADGDESADDSAVTPISAAGGDDPAAATAATADTHSPPPVPSSEDEVAAAADVSEDGAATGMSPGPAVPKTKPTFDTAQMATELRRARDSALYYKRWEGRLRRVLVFGAVVLWLLGNARAARGITDGRDPPGNAAVVDLERACSQRMSDAFGLSGGDERPLAMLAPFVEALLSGAARITATLRYSHPEGPVGVVYRNQPSQTTVACKKTDAARPPLLPPAPPLFLSLVIIRHPAPATRTFRP